MKLIATILMNISVLGVIAQYTYFNQTYGEFGDQETESISNVEVIGDTIYMFGGIDNDQDPFSFLLRAIDMGGNLLIEKTVPMPFSTYIGDGEAVSKIGTEGFIYTQSPAEGESVGLAVLYDINLDTLWLRTYDYVIPSATYFRSNIIDGTSVMIVGEFFGFPNQTGTFIMKLDFEGNVIWSNLLHDQNEGHVYSNSNILALNEGYLIGGFRQGPFTSMLTKTDLEGNIEWEYYADNFVDTEGEQASTIFYRLAQLPNGEIVGAHMVYYEYYGPTSIPNTNPLWYRSLHLSKINVADTSMYWEHDYFTDHEIKATVIWKIIPTVDNGILAMGVEQDETNYTWLLKVDSIGNEEWFNYYSYSENIEDRNNMFDIEATSDGGYIMVGNYHNYMVDDYAKSWVMKIDACGDVEWQGCNYVGIQESKKQQYKIYPNPTTDYIIIEGEYSHKARVYVYDLLGNMVVRQRLTHSGRVNLTSLSTGVYSLVMEDAGELRSVGKIAVEN